MPVNGAICKEHSGHEARIENLEKEDKNQWISINSSHKRIDGMKNWVIAGMTSLLIQLLVIVGYFVTKIF